MRVLVVTGIFPPDFGGPATYVPAIAGVISRDHHIVGVITLSDGPFDDTPFPYRVLRIARCQFWPIRVFKTVALIKRMAREADVAFLNGLMLEGILACKVLSNRSVVMKVVGDLIWEQARRVGCENSMEEFQNRRQSVRWEMLKRLQSWYVNKADRVIVPSKYLMSIVAKWGVSPSRLVVVYNSVCAEESVVVGNGKPCFDMVTVARLVPWKGISELITLAHERGWTLKIIGDGPMRQELEALVKRLQMGRSVKFSGNVSVGRVADEIRDARVFVLNSSYEGLPHVVLEAKAAGVPVVATAVGGTPETIHDAVDGYLVPDGDRESLGDRVHALLVDAELRWRVCKAAHQQLAEQFSFSRMVEETTRVLRDVVEVGSCLPIKQKYSADA